LDLIHERLNAPGGVALAIGLLGGKIRLNGCNLTFDAFGVASKESANTASGTADSHLTIHLKLHLKKLYRSQ
jgi:hypothetical protein